MDSGNNFVELFWPNFMNCKVSSKAFLSVWQWKNETGTATLTLCLHETLNLFVHAYLYISLCREACKSSISAQKPANLCIRALWHGYVDDEEDSMDFGRDRVKENTCSPLSYGTRWCHACQYGVLPILHCLHDQKHYSSLLHHLLPHLTQPTAL